MTANGHSSVVDKNQPMQPVLRMLSVEDILNCSDLKDEIVEVPEWNGAVRIQSLTKGQEQDVRAQCTQDGVLDTPQYETRIFIAGVVEPQFKETDYHRLKDKNAGAVLRVIQRIVKLSGMDSVAPDRAKS